MSTPRLNSYLHHYVKRNSLIPLCIDASVLAFEYEVGVDDPVAFCASDSIKGAGISSLIIESSGIVDADEALEITYGGTTFTINLGTDGATTLYSDGALPGFVVDCVSSDIVLTATADQGFETVATIATGAILDSDNLWSETNVDIVGNAGYHTYADGKHTIIRNASGYAEVRLNSTVTIGSRYVLTFTAYAEGGEANHRAAFYGGPTAGYNFASTYTYTNEFTATADNIKVKNFADGYSMAFSDVTLKLVKPRIVSKGDVKHFYDSLLYGSKPNLYLYGMEPFRTVYAYELWVGAEDRTNPNTAQIAAVAAANTAKVVCLDIEHWSLEGDWAMIEATVAKFVSVAQTWKANDAAGARIGFFGELPIRKSLTSLLDPSDPSYVAWSANNALLMPIADEVDLIFPNLYTTHEDPDDWLTFAAAHVSESKQYGHPILPYIWPEYHESATPEGYLPSAYWQAQLEFIGDSADCDGAVFWGGYEQAFDVSQDWWVSTQVFLGQYKANATAAQWQTMLRALKYKNTAAEPTTGARSFVTHLVTHLNHESSDVTKTITVSE